MTSLRAQLDQIRAESGRLTPANVVEAARPEDAPLHDRFEWDDAVAGERYRLVQARDLIQRVMVVRAGEPSTGLRAYVSITRGSESSPEYVPVEEAADDPFTAQLVLQQAERDWREMFRRYQHLAEFLDLVRRDVAA